MNRRITDRLISFLKENISEDEISRAWNMIDKKRCPLSIADRDLYDKLTNLVEDFAYDKEIDDIFAEVDVEELFEEL